MNTIDVSVIVLTYNSDYKKTVKTINSVLNQKNCNFEIIIADDGSRINNFEKIRTYFKDLNFINYTLLGDRKNRGTVLNLLNALRNSMGNYIKPISPGDYLYDDTTLYEMLTTLSYKNGVACFGSAVYYSIKKGTFVYAPYRKHPYYIKPYLKQNKNAIRNNYLVSRDPILGATLLYKKDLLSNVLTDLVENVFYCEDSVLNIMAANKNRIVYLSKPVIFYEANTGISSRRKGQWAELIYKDNKFVFNYLLQKGLLTKNEFYKSFSNKILQKWILTIRLDFFKFLIRKIDRRYKIINTMPSDLLDKITYITSL